MAGRVLLLFSLLAACSGKEAAVPAPPSGPYAASAHVEADSCTARPPSPKHVLVRVLPGGPAFHAVVPFPVSVEPGEEDILAPYELSQAHPVTFDEAPFFECPKARRVRDIHIDHADAQGFDVVVQERWSIPAASEECKLPATAPEHTCATTTRLELRAQH